MNAAVLVLDVGMRPLRVENWQRAICDLFLGKVAEPDAVVEREVHQASAISGSPYSPFAALKLWRTRSSAVMPLI